jgi:hypothetical protein
MGISAISVPQIEELYTSLVFSYLQSIYQGFYTVRKGVTLSLMALRALHNEISLKPFIIFSFAYRYFNESAPIINKLSLIL